MRSFSGCNARQGWRVERRAEQRRAYLVAWILVDAAPVAMVVAAVFEVIAVVSGHGQSAASVSGKLAAWAMTAGAASRAARAPTRDGRSHGAGRAVHSPIRCHCDHWDDVEQQTAARAGAGVDFSTAGGGGLVRCGAGLAMGGSEDGQRSRGTGLLGRVAAAGCSTRAGRTATAPAEGEERRDVCCAAGRARVVGAGDAAGGAACEWCRFSSRHRLLGSRSTWAGGQAGRTAGIHSVIRAGAMREGYLRHHPQTPATTHSSVPTVYTDTALLLVQLRPRPEAARGGWIHLLVLLGTARALSH